MRKSRFKFLMNPKIEVRNKQAMSKLTLRQMEDRSTSLYRAREAARLCLDWATNAFRVQESFVRLDLFSNEEEGLRDLARMKQAVDRAKAAFDDLVEATEIFMALTVEMEAELDDKRILPKAARPVPKVTNQPNEVLNLSAQPPASPRIEVIQNGEPASVQGRSSAPPPPAPEPKAPEEPKLKPAKIIDPKLLIKARREMQERQKNQASRLSDAGVGAE